MKYSQIFGFFGYFYLSSFHSFEARLKSVLSRIFFCSTTFSQILTEKSIPPPALELKAVS
nr:MAG TPA: hypothetical protein [Bacteriophage sp.]